MIKKYFHTIENPRKQKFIKTALRIGVKITVLSPEFRVLKLEYKDRAKLMYNEEFFFNKKPSTLFTKNKEVTKLLLRENNIHTPKGIFAENLDEAIELVKKDGLKYPLVVKPIDAMKGLGVTVGIENETQLWHAIDTVNKFWKYRNGKHKEIFMVEEMVQGKDFRVLVLNKKVIACIERIPAHITGDGKLTIEAIIKKFNKNRPANFHLVIDEEIKKTLHTNNINLNSVLPKGLKLWLRKNANISSGGIAVDKTQKISNRFKRLAVKSVLALGLHYGGVDIMTNNITSESPSQEYSLIEINGAPDYDIHEKPIVQGRGVEVTKLLVRHLMEVNI